MQYQFRNTGRIIYLFMNCRSPLFEFKNLYALIFFLLITSIPALAQIGGELNTPDENDIWAKTLEGSSFSEFWNYQIYLDNGITLYIIFSVSDISSLRSSVSGIRVSMYNLDGANYEINREYPLENLAQDDDEYKFDINPRQDNIWFKGKLPESHEIYINTDKSGDRFKINLHFENIQKGVKFGDGIFDINGENIGIITHIPFARVTGYAGIDENVKDVTGTAYMDHTFQYDNPGKLLQSGYRFIQHTSSNQWELTYFLDPKNSINPGLLGYHLSNVEGNVTAQSIQLEEGVADYNSSNDEFPEEFSINLDDDQVITFFHQSEIDRRSVFADLNWIARNFARRLIGGEYYDHRGVGEMQINDGSPRPGHFNYFIVR